MACRLKEVPVRWCGTLQSLSQDVTYQVLAKTERLIFDYQLKSQVQRTSGDSSLAHPVMLFLFAPWPRLEWTRLLLQEPNQQLPCMFLTHSSEMHQPSEWKWQGSPGGFVIAFSSTATATTGKNDHLILSPGSKVVMKCKMWCLDLEHNEVAQVYASQIKDRVVRFGMEHPGSQVPE